MIGQTIKIRNIIFTFVAALLVLYFIYHSFSGDRGVFVYLKLKKEYQEIQMELETTRAERLEVEHKVNLLQNDSLDLDLLEERARKILFYVKDNEEVVFEQN